jgi:hypothetical protein
MRKASRANGVVVAPLWEGVTGQRGCPEIPCQKPHLATGVADAPCGRQRKATRCRWRPLRKASRGDCVALQQLPHGLLRPPGCLLTPCPRRRRGCALPRRAFGMAIPGNAVARERLPASLPGLRVACPTHVRCHRIATRCSPAPSPMAIARYQVARDPLAADLDRPRVAFRTHGACAREATSSPGARFCMVSQTTSLPAASPRMASRRTSLCEPKKLQDGPCEPTSWRFESLARSQSRDSTRRHWRLVGTRGRDEAIGLFLAVSMG